MLTLRLIDVIFCLSETFLDKGILSDDVNLDIPGYNLVRADHSANTKGGGVCIYFRKSLPLRILDIHFFLMNPKTLKGELEIIYAIYFSI